MLLTLFPLCESRRWHRSRNAAAGAAGAAAVVAARGMLAARPSQVGRAEAEPRRPATPASVATLPELSGTPTDQRKPGRFLFYLRSFSQNSGELRCRAGRLQPRSAKQLLGPGGERSHEHSRGVRTGAPAHRLLGGAAARPGQTATRQSGLGIVAPSRWKPSAALVAQCGAMRLPALLGRLALRTLPRALRPP